MRRGLRVVVVEGLLLLLSLDGIFLTNSLLHRSIWQLIWEIALFLVVLRAAGRWLFISGCLLYLTVFLISTDTKVYDQFMVCSCLGLALVARACIFVATMRTNTTGTPLSQMREALSNARLLPKDPLIGDWPKPRKGDIKLSLIFFAATWILLSVYDNSRVGISIPNPPPKKSNWPSKHVALALSGGGYRAALLHAGVVDGLNQLRVPISSITSVSGGSIFASLYVHGLEPKAFVTNVTAGHFNVMRKLVDLNHVGGLFVVLPHPFRLLAQADALSKAGLLETSLREIDRRDINLMIVATDLGTGSAVGLTRYGYLERNMLAPARPENLYANIEPRGVEALKLDADGQLLWYVSPENEWPGAAKTSELVAASGAFPLAFEPLKLYTRPDSPSENNYLQLVDGGVSDNSAMTLSLDADFLGRSCKTNHFKELSRWESDLVIASDGSQSFDSSGTEYGAISAAARAVDATFARVGMRPIYFNDEQLRKSIPSAILISPSKVMRDKENTKSTEIWKAFEQLDDESVTYISDTLRDDPFEDTESRESFAYDSANLRVNVQHEEHPGMQRARSRGRTENDLELEITADAKVFFNSPTLSSSYSVSNGRKLYRLGWLLAMLNGPAIERVLNSGPDSSVDSARSSLSQYYSCF